MLGVHWFPQGKCSECSSYQFDSGLSNWSNSFQQFVFFAETKWNKNLLDEQSLHMFYSEGFWLTKGVRMGGFWG